ncbi:MAG: outer membrane beta-barrel family protein [Saprospiraceae bacterium]|nr:outer membrane beta-barrel family protein [Saprospiraceae bacterium]MDG2419638.1 outer membrane beta-barrel family protein [Saprospiraceae bacterium]
MNYLKTLLFILISSNFLFAQNQKIEITGTVLDKNSQNPVEFATVMIGDNKTKTAITGVTTELDGEFKVETNATDFYIEISFIGFENKTITEFSIKNGKVSLGQIYMSENNQELEEVVVRAEKSTTEFRLDKRVFNVGKDLSSTGASALEVLNNVPSVNVDIEGAVSLRGSSGVQILINGKPSVLASEQGNALGTITADMIDKIEVITNPSAKYDAEGTSGIINIVIKKEERKGINGSVSINTGFPQNHSIGLSLNRRTEKFNLFSQVGVGYREMPNDSENINRDLVNGKTVYSNGTEHRNEKFYNLILGTDYHINKNNVLTLSGSFAYEVEEQPSLINFKLEDAAGDIINEWSRTETTEANNPKYRYELQYKSNLKGHKDHALLISGLGNFFGKDQSSKFFNNETVGSEAFADQQTATNFKEGKYTFSLDYTKPFSDKITLETGAQYVINNVSNDFEVRNLINDEWIADASLTNLFEYDQKVLGVYGTGAYEGDKWGVKLGLRMENTDLKTLLVNTNQDNEINFTNFFPTLHTSYKLTEAFSIQGGYSRRIFRPRLWDLNPFFNIRNTFSIRTGNPDLLPEFTDSYEVSSIYIAGKTTFSASVYHRYTTDVVERVSTFENNVNTTMPMNIGTNRSTGLEINVKYSASKKLSFNGDFNYNYFNRQGELEATSFDFNANRWSSKITSKIKFPAGIDFEITGQYRSKYQTVQSVVSGNLFADIGLRKKIMKGKGVLNFSVRDLIASRIRESETSQDDFYAYSFRQRGRFITLGFSYGFGKGEAMEFSGAKRRH